MCVVAVRRHDAALGEPHAPAPIAAHALLAGQHDLCAPACSRCCIPHTLKLTNGRADARIGTSGTSGDGSWPSEWLEGGSPEYLAVMEPPYNTQRPDLGRPLLDDHGELFYLAGPKL